MRKTPKENPHTKRIAELEVQVAALEQKNKMLSDEFMKALQEKSKGITDGIELTKAEKQLRVIGHIAAGRSNEAITEILEPIPVMFAIDVRFADDKSRIHAEDELLNSVKKVTIDAISACRIKRNVAEPNGSRAE